MPALQRLLSKIPLARQLHARPRLLLATLLGALTVWGVPDAWVSQTGSRVLLGWNVGALLYLGLVAELVLVVLAAAAVLYAIASQLASAKGLQGMARNSHVALAALTMLSSWLFTQTMFALHYAHDFYLARQRQLPDPLDFPGTTEPGYLDFSYFAFVIGTSGQTADVAFSGHALRRAGLLHCVVAFFFNTTLLALMVNIAAGLF
jgi:uncharacterized membrane protein